MAIRRLPRSDYARVARKGKPGGMGQKHGGCIGLCAFSGAVCRIILLTVGAGWHQMMAAVSSSIVQC